MSARYLILTLHPVSSTDTFPYRALTFTPKFDTIPIGRASKSESKNLAPAENNGWFESRVMSRNHAMLRASLQNEDIYVCDCGSMHGTFVNQKKIPVDHDVTIRNGDILMFGNEVTRGSETFPPLQVRCQCEWFDISKAPTVPVPEPEKQVPNQSTNTFAVPDDDDDDDDDVVEIAPESTPPKLAPHPQFIILDSDTDSDSDDSRLLDHQSPVTSPLVKDMDVNNTEEQPQTPHGADRPKTDATTHLNPSDGDRQTPELPNDRLQSSPSNPPGAYPEAEDKCYSQAADSESESELMQVSPAEEVTDLESDNWDMEQISPESCLSDELGDDDSLNEDYSVASSPRSVSPSYKAPYVVTERSSEGCLQSNGWESGRQSFENTPPSQLTKGAVHQQSTVPETAPVAAHNSAPGSQSLSQTPADNSQANTRLGEVNYDPVQYQDNWPADSSPHRVPSPSDKAMAKTSNPPVPSYSYGTFAPSFDEWPVPQASSHPPQVPFNPYQPPALNSLHSYANYLPQSFPLPQSRSSLRNLGPSPSTPFVEQFSDERLNDYRTKPIGSCGAFGQVPPAFVQGNTHPVNASEFPKPPLDQGNSREKPTVSSAVTATTTTRVSIADIVDESGSEVQCPDVKRPPKRKDADTELEHPLSETDDPGELQSFSDCPVPSSSNHVESDEKDTTTSLPDAQLQPAVKDLAPNSQLTETSVLQSEPAQPMDTDTRKPEPRRKRIKIRHENHGGTLRYTAAALAGAVAGSIATVAVLASLPPDFFAPGAF